MKHFLAFLFFSSLLFDINGVEASNQNHNLYHVRPTKLFVFGDSYVDTGNIIKPEVVSRKFPYGITFPGKPSGRFSDGLVATDFVAQAMGIKSPIPYVSKESVGKEQLQYGMNFAYGGTGVFTTLTPLPNMTTQIDFFQKLLTTSGNIYSPSDLNSSIALVSVAGNDYSYYYIRNGSVAGFPTFIKQVLSQIEVDLRRIHALGVKKIAVASLQPLGCLPSLTVLSSYQRCNEPLNALVVLHNKLLQQVVAKLNSETGKHSSFVLLDYYSAFLAVFKKKGTNLGSKKFETPLKPCCKGNCGNVDEKGVKKYSLCDDPKSDFFWDNLHPSQEGWRSVYSLLGKPLTEFLTKV
ncbi:GDSL esterase/lipase At5g03610 isoform X2 [Capsella rubella]|uniref:GDSL esterase/lipase At5g03610 isoform X2 n=1 Tax=Capsella rubella TaxID=81985 RepID=UPI000CD4D328|nr:GDSL esterase/lipase At5g03610 isoform X2 [Capsella rubella]